MNGYRRPAAAAGKSVMLLAAGWISAIASLFFYPFVFGAAGVVSGILSSRTGSRSALILIVASMTFMTAGVLFRSVLQDFLRIFPGI